MSPHTETHAHGGPKIYAKVLLTLLALTCLTVFVARHPFENNTINVVVALIVATIKATFVALIFMHLKYDKKINSVVAASGFIFLSLLLFACLTDFNTRDNIMPTNTGNTAVAQPAAQLAKP